MIMKILLISTLLSSMKASTTIECGTIDQTQPENKGVCYLYSESISTFDHTVCSAGQVCDFTPPFRTNKNCLNSFNIVIKIILSSDLLYN